MSSLHPRMSKSGLLSKPPAWAFLGHLVCATLVITLNAWLRILLDVCCVKNRLKVWLYFAGLDVQEINVGVWRGPVFIYFFYGGLHTSKISSQEVLGCLILHRIRYFCIFISLLSVHPSYQWWVRCCRPFKSCPPNAYNWQWQNVLNWCKNFDIEPWRMLILNI